MARSATKTWLPLDRWFEIVGVNPLHANQLVSSTLLPTTVCGEVFFQYAWQHSDRVGREDIAMAIQSAEGDISAEVGYNLIPDWTIQERLGYPLPALAGVYNIYGTNPRGMLKSVELPRGHIISGGIRASSLIQTGAAVVRTDEDTDTFAETCTVTVPTTVTDENEIHLYYPAKNGAPAWEIRPISVTLSGGNAIITFKVWQIAAANQLDAINPEPLDAHDAASFETTVDIYRIYNDPSTQVQFLWENDSWLNCCGTCVACQLSTQAGCFHLRDARLGFAVPSPASWSAADEEFTELEWSACREPDQVRFWYYSGFRDMSLARPNVEMARYWEYAVAYLAASKLDRPVCGCSNVQQFIEKWRQDVMIYKDDGATINITSEMLGNRIGTSMGAIYAWKAIQRNGKRINK